MRRTLTYLIPAGLLWMLIPFGLKAQQAYRELFWGPRETVRAEWSVAGESRFAAILPAMEKQVRINADDSISDLLYMGILKPRKVSSHILDLKWGKTSIKIDPLIDLYAGVEVKGNGITGGGGLGLKTAVDAGKSFSAGGYVRFNQTSLPAALNEKVKATRVLPAMGYAHRSALGGYYSWDGAGWINYNFLRHFNVEAGMGRNFWGDGYRSFFISDGSFSYPYIKITTSVWKIKYVNLYAQMKDMRMTSSGRWDQMRTKYGSFHFLSWDIHKRVNIGFFEAIIWQAGDSVSKRGFDVNYINPLIFYRPVEFAIGSPDNSLMGVSLKVKVGRKNFFYGQFLMDDIIIGEFSSGSVNRIRQWFGSADSGDVYGYWTNKQAWQLGFSAYDIFGLKGMGVQAEYNAARPYTYSHRLSNVNYAHYNEPLAHPAGANFSEFLFFIRYHHKRWYSEVQFMWLQQGLDSAGTHFGADIFQSTFDSYFPELDNVPVQQYYNSIGQGIRSLTLYGALRAACIINPAVNLRAEAELSFRKQKVAASDSWGLFFMVGIRTSAFGWRTDR